MDYSLQHKKLQPKFDIVIPFLKFEGELNRELVLNFKKIISKDNYYYTVEPLNEKPIWAQEWLPDCQLFEFNSKNEAVKFLKSQKNLGVFLPTSSHQGLANSIQADLRELKIKRIQFLVPAVFNFQYFVWTILSDKKIAICTKPHSRFPLGWHEFNEDKETPPNRAYLKLWEALCLGYIDIKSSESVIDLGSSPGGWSWVLSERAKTVYSIDKAPLEPKIAQLPNIAYTSADAFLVKPGDYPNCSWLFSDIICAPQRLLELVQRWSHESNIKNYMCTLKFKGNCDFDIINQFLKFDNSRIIHLYQNKNEVTWIKQGAK